MKATSSNCKLWGAEDYEEELAMVSCKFCGLHESSLINSVDCMQMKLIPELSILFCRYYLQL